MFLKDRTAAITGSTSGIGLAYARALAAEGANLVINGIMPPADAEKLRTDLEKEFGIKVVFSGADMTKPAEIAGFIAEGEKVFGAIDILINNAGIQFVSPIDEFPIEKWDQIIAINLSSSFHTIRAAVPHMKRKGWGRIINVASAHGLVASPYKVAYVAAKHGVVGFTKVTALENARLGIIANAICPGYVKTPLIEAQIVDQAKTRGIPEDRVMEEVILAAQPNKQFVEYEHLAGMLLYLVSDMGASATGAAMVLDGGWTAT